MKYILFFLFSQMALAGPIVSVGVGKSIFEHKAFERVVHVGYQVKLLNNISIKPEVGYWLDTENPKASSFWAGMPLLLEVASPAGTFVRMGFGPSYVRSVPNGNGRLATHWEFDIEGGIGMQDKNCSLGLFYKHFSNAGIRQFPDQGRVNMGRDFITIQAQFTGL